MTTNTLALEALNFARKCIGHPDNIAIVDKYIAALQEQADPVSWQYRAPQADGSMSEWRSGKLSRESAESHRTHYGYEIRDLYAAPQPPSAQPASTAQTDERAAHDAWFVDQYGHIVHSTKGEYRMSLEGWKGRALLSCAPAKEREQLKENSNISLAASWAEDTWMASQIKETK